MVYCINEEELKFTSQECGFVSSCKVFLSVSFELHKDEKFQNSLILKKLNY